MVAHGVAVALGHDDLRAVEEPLPRDAVEEPRGTHERAAERFDRQIEDKLGPHRARVREHHDEDPERARAAGDGERAHVGPVDLRLLADEPLGPEVHLTARDGPHLGHVTAQDRDPSLVPTRADHVEEAGRTKARMALQRLVDEGLIRADEARPRRKDERAVLSGIEYAGDDIGVHAELGDDRSRLPLLDVVKPPDLVLLGEIDRHDVTPSRQSWRSSPKLPKPAIRRPRRWGSRSATATS